MRTQQNMSVAAMLRVWRNEISSLERGDAVWMQNTELKPGGGEGNQKRKGQRVGENIDLTGRKNGPDHVKINIYGEIPTLIKQNC